MFLRKGNNIRQRKDGRFEARYIKDRDENGKIIWGYCYGLTYEEAERKRNASLSYITPIRQLNLLILGAGDCGREVEELVKLLRVFNSIDFLDDNPETGAIGPCEDFGQYIGDYPVAIAAVGDNALRVNWTMELIKEGFAIPTLIHPSANVMANTHIGPGSIICAGATVGLGAQIGRGCIISSGATIGKNTFVEDWTLVNEGETIIHKKD